MERMLYGPLAARKAPRALGFQQPSTFTDVAVDSPAIAVMTDLRQVSAATIEAEVSLIDASVRYNGCTIVAASTPICTLAT